MNQTLSILIPCYNEEPYIEILLNKIVAIRLPDPILKEIIVVDDHSSDRSAAIVEDFINRSGCDTTIRLFKNAKNAGKGGSIRKALELCTGDFVIIQDADLEYHPAEYPKLLQPILDGYADVVYGSRFRGSEAHRVLFFFHSAGNKLLTFLSNLLTGLNLTDMETGHKMFKKEVIKSIVLRENRFGLEPEITAKISRIKGVRIYEVGISYYGRSYEEGKKIGWRDGFRAIYCIIKYNIFSKK